MNKAELIKSIKATIKDSEKGVEEMEEHENYDDAKIYQGWVECAKCILKSVRKLK